ncbi:MAG: DUF6165 family protein [Gammaproteobacteria bacterium]|nr:hypothetical protein [Gammaproteobacteria bacterium]
MSLVSIPVSIGELIDKLVILEIKADRIREPAKLQHINHELDLLTNTWLTSGQAGAEIGAQREALKAVNEALWDIEDQIRQKEADAEFDQKFIELARAIYINNDRRSALKREINRLLGSELVEEKSYPAYAPATGEGIP